VTSQFDIIFVFPNQPFGQVCRRNMHILLHALLIYVSWYQGVLLKKRCGNGVPTPNIKEDCDLPTNTRISTLDLPVSL